MSGSEHFAEDSISEQPLSLGLGDIGTEMHYEAQGYGSIEVFLPEDDTDIQNDVKVTDATPNRRRFSSPLLLAFFVLAALGALHVVSRIERNPPSIATARLDMGILPEAPTAERRTVPESEMTIVDKAISATELAVMGEEGDLVRCSCPFPGAPSPFNNYVCYPSAYNEMCSPNEVCKEINIIQVGQPSAIHLGYFMCTDHVCAEGATCTCASPGGAPGTNSPQSNCFVCKNPDGTACINYILTGINQCCPESHVCSSVASVNHAIAAAPTNNGGLCQAHR
jgi:hypothetical protein